MDQSGRMTQTLMPRKDATSGAIGRDRDSVEALYNGGLAGCAQGLRRPRRPQMCASRCCEQADPAGGRRVTIVGRIAAPRPREDHQPRVPLSCLALHAELVMEVEPSVGDTARGAGPARRPGLLQRLVDPFRQYGVGAGLLYLIDRVMRTCSARTGLFVYELMVQPIHVKPKLPASLRRQITFREIRQGDAEIDGMPARDDIKAARFRQRARCLGAFLKGRLVGYLWYCRDAYEEDEVRCTFVLPPGGDSVFDFDLYVMPEYRTGIGFAAVWDIANAHFDAAGVRRTYSRLTRFNLPSRRAHRHLGWQVAGRAVFVELWSAQVMVATLRPYVHLSLRGATRARLALP
jgi:hypothetical protein